MAPSQKDLMQNITSIELSNYVQNVGTPAPGIDRIQFEVLRVMLYHPDFEGFCLENLVLSLANEIISSKNISWLNERGTTYIHPKRWRPSSPHKLPSHCTFIVALQGSNRSLELSINSTFKRPWLNGN
jgi:hypothetical protein